MKQKVLVVFLTVFAVICMTGIPAVMAVPVPDTGQTKCYDSSVEITCPQEGEPFYGQDAQYSTNLQSYTKLDENGNDLSDSATEWVMVRDNVTGLIWEVKQANDDIADYSNPHDANNQYTWYDGNPDTNSGDAGTPGDDTDTEDFINTLNNAQFGGYNDWRMPTVKELSLIVKCQGDNSVIDTTVFPYTVSSSYWSSTTNAGDTGSAWCVHFNNGIVYYVDKSSSYYARAVRSGQSESLDNFVINGDGTVTDTSTGLIWQQETTDNMTWEDALTYCENLSLAGHDEWRLPNRNEMQTLLDYVSVYPAIDTTIFPDTISSIYWSSTTNANNTSYAWHSSFGSGFLGISLKSNMNYYVRAVTETSIYIITSSAGAGGSISPSGDVTVRQGVDQIFDITANSGYHVSDVLVDGVSVGGVTSYIFSNVTSDHSIEAQFAVTETSIYIITSSAGAGGSISPSGDVTVTQGADQAFDITSNSGYHVLDVLVDGVSAGDVTSYTFSNVNEDHAISASFKEDEVDDRDDKDDDYDDYYCFIATAAFGSSMEPHVKTLRDFRDVFLLTNKPGQYFVQTYYKYSPPLADFIAKNDTRRAVVRWSLLPLVGMSLITLHLGITAAVIMILLTLLLTIFIVSFFKNKVSVEYKFINISRLY